MQPHPHRTPREGRLHGLRNEPSAETSPKDSLIQADVRDLDRPIAVSFQLEKADVVGPYLTELGLYTIDSDFGSFKMCGHRPLVP